MKKYMICGLIALMFTISFTASAQYGRNNGRYSRSYHYNRYPSRPAVSIIARLPVSAVSITFGDRYYHYYNGFYYRPYNHSYMIVPPPIGILVPSLPIGSVHVVIGSNPYYRHGNIFYVPSGNWYKVVEEPQETETSQGSDDKTENTATSEYEKVVVEGKTYYIKGDKYYKASVNKNGEVIYEEVGETVKSK